MNDLAALHPMAPAHLPRFVTPPGQTDWMMVNVGIVLVGGILLLGVLYLTLHSVPDRIAHRKNAMQFQLIAVLTVLALFTHNQLFWLLALLIAVVEVPNVMVPLQSIAASLERATGRRDDAEAPPATPAAPATPTTAAAPDTNPRGDHV